MKQSKLLALLVALAMLMAMVPGLPTMAAEPITATMSYTASSGSNVVPYMGMPGNSATRPYAVAWAGGSPSGYRYGCLAFPLSDVQLEENEVYAPATLTLVLRHTVNCDAGDTMTLYAADYDKIQNQQIAERGAKIGVLTIPSGVTNNTESGGSEISVPVTAQIDLNAYMKAFPNATGLGLIMMNRNDVAECASDALLGFFGYDEGDKAPTLEVTKTSLAQATVSLKCGDVEIADSFTMDGVLGGEYTLTEAQAPLMIEKDGVRYLRDDSNSLTFTMTDVATSVVITYSVTEEIVADLAATDSYTVKWSTNTRADLDGFPYRPYAISWTEGGLENAWRSSYVAFSYGDLPVEGKLFDMAELHMTISRTQNVSGGATSIGVFATDYSQVNNATPGMPEKSVRVGTIVVPFGTDAQNSSLTIPVTATLDLSEYRALFPDAEGVALYLSNNSRDEADSYGLIGFYGYNEAGNAPKLRVRTATPVTLTVELKAGETIFDSFTWENRLKNHTYALTQEQAPAIIVENGQYYLRDDITKNATVTTAETDSTVVVAYHAATVSPLEQSEAVCYVGSVPTLQKTIAVTFSDGQSMRCDVTWDADELAAATEPGVYTIHGAVAQFPELAPICTLTIKEFTARESVVTNNGAWNWYVEPSGTHIQPGDEFATRYENDYATGGYQFQHDKTYMGWVEDGGSVYVSEYDHDTGSYTRVLLHKNLESDDHDNPAIVVLPDGRIMAVYSMHTNEPYMYYRVSKYPEDITEWHDEQYYRCVTNNGIENNTTYNATYPTVLPVNIGGKDGEDKIYMGWRGVHWKPTLAILGIPDENGVCEVLMGQTQIVNPTTNDRDTGNRPYTKYDYDHENGIIHITCTTHHPDNDAHNEIYYLYLNLADNKLYSAKDRYLQDLPFENRTEYGTGTWGVNIPRMRGEYPELLVFVPGGQNRRGWTWDIKANAKGEPCIVYADITNTPPNADGTPPTEYNGNEDRAHHYYYYARWDKETEEWVTTFLTYGGKWFHENIALERCYSGGVTMDHNYDDANVLYLAIPTMGQYGNMFEIYRWESSDHGATWTKQEPLTQNSKINNARPHCIYNYKMDEDGNNLGPRLLWLRGEYRYWNNYHYKTGVMTDFEGLETQDDPEMKADANLLDADGNDVTALVSGTPYTAKFNLTNISIQDGTVKLALAHYSADGAMKNIVTRDVIVPARSIPQYAVKGTPKTADGGSSTMGTEEIVEYLDYTADYAEGDTVKLLAWSMGMEKFTPITGIPYEISTEGSKYLMRDTLTYEGDDILRLGAGESWNGWIANTVAGSMTDRNYAAVTRIPFSNTGILLNRQESGSVIVSHALPEIDEDYVVEFSVRLGIEMDWWAGSKHLMGFTLSNAIPTSVGDTNAKCAFQLRDRNVGGTNGRRSIFSTYNTDTYLMTDGNYLNHIDYVANSTGWGDRFENDSERLMENALMKVRLTVRPSAKTIRLEMNDGHRTGVIEQAYQGSSSYWDTNKIRYITFNTGLNANDEIHIDDFSVYTVD